MYCEGRKVNELKKTKEKVKMNFLKKALMITKLSQHPLTYWQSTKRGDEDELKFEENTSGSFATVTKVFIKMVKYDFGGSRVFTIFGKTTC